MRCLGFFERLCYEGLWHGRHYESMCGRGLQFVLRKALWGHRQGATSRVAETLVAFVLDPAAHLEPLYNLLGLIQNYYPAP